MTTESALLAAILADPADDTPRLVYADWCDENGQPDRAEFIRAQCELARPCRLGYSDAYHVDDVCHACDELRRREGELRSDENKAAWFGSTYFNRISASYSRGFVSHVTCSWSDWHTHADSILRVQPIERVRLTDWLPIRSGMVCLELPTGERIMNGNRDIRKAHLAVAKVQWPRIEFELPPAEPTNSATWQFNLDLAAAENR